MKKNKKDILAAILGVVVTAAVVLAVVAVIILIDAGLLCLLGVRSASFGHLVGYVLLASVVGLPLELFTNGLAGALFRLGWASRRMANLLYIPQDTLCSALAFWGTDLLLDQVEANGFAILIVALVSAVFSQPIEKVKQNSEKRTGKDDGGPNE